MDLGNVSKLGAIPTAGAPNRYVAGGWVVTFAPAILPTAERFEVWHAAIRGPGGQFLVYIDDLLYGVGQNGSINEYSPSGSAMLVRKGQTITLNWSIATGTAPTAWLYLREPEVGRI